MVADRLKRLTTDLASFEQTLHSQGEFDVGAAQPGDQVAFQEDADSEWVLGRVLSWMHETGQYEVMDEDDNSKKLTIDEHQVVPLEGRSERLQKGDNVLAVYVDTTSFYNATIAIPPRGRGAQIVSPSMLKKGRCSATPFSFHCLVLSYDYHIIHVRRRCLIAIFSFEVSRIEKMSYVLPRVVPYYTPFGGRGWRSSRCQCKRIFNTV
ncbi:unnamed protein product [Pylaiella littoralis]